MEEGGGTMTHITRQVILYTDLGTSVPWKNNLNPPYSTFVVGPIQGIGGNLLTWAFNFKFQNSVRIK